MYLLFFGGPLERSREMSHNITKISLLTPLQMSQVDLLKDPEKDLKKVTTALTLLTLLTLLNLLTLLTLLTHKVEKNLRKMFAGTKFGKSKTPFPPLSHLLHTSFFHSL
jgi:hypothetical protein